MSDKENDPLNISINESTSLINSFGVTFWFLAIIGFIIFSFALINTNLTFNKILFVQAFICAITCGFSYLHISYLKGIKESWPNYYYTYNGVTNIRYLDWTLTTPLILICLCLILNDNKNSLSNLIIPISLILFSNWIMLSFNYLGEKNLMSKNISGHFSYIFLIITFVIIFMYFIRNSMNNIKNNILFVVYIIIWLLYSLSYFLDEEAKNIMNNIVDIIAKAFLALLFVYYSFNSTQSIGTTNSNIKINPSQILNSHRYF